MLKITIPSREYFDDKKQEFIKTKETELTLEHSLLSLFKWEQKWKKPFLKEGYQKTYEETIDYIRCMTLTPNIDPNLYYNLDQKTVEEIGAYINDPHTATTFNEPKKEGEAKRKVKPPETAETIYCSMVMAGIPFECQKWHINNLLTLIKTYNVKNDDGKKKKHSKGDIAKNRAAINAQRLKKYGTKG